jgi:cytochrome c biogenesis protein CcmG, thiol:disulfide interchange protein DsbE
MSEHPDATSAEPAATQPGAPEPARSTHTARRVALAVAAVLALFVCLLATRSPISDKETRSPLIGRVAPEFEGPSLLGGGEAVSLQSLRARNKFVLLNFFGSYCIPCRKEHPELIAIAKAHPNDLSIVSITFDDNNDDARDYFKKNGGDGPLLDLPRVAVDYGAAKIPETFLIDPNGIVLSKASGPLTAKRFEQVFAEAKGAP